MMKKMLFLIALVAALLLAACGQQKKVEYHENRDHPLDFPPVAKSTTAKADNPTNKCAADMVYIESKDDRQRDGQVFVSDPANKETLMVSFFPKGGTAQKPSSVCVAWTLHDTRKMYIQAAVREHGAFAEFPNVARSPKFVLDYKETQAGFLRYTLTAADGKVYSEVSKVGHHPEGQLVEPREVGFRSCNMAYSGMQGWVTNSHGQSSNESEPLPLEHRIYISGDSAVCPMVTVKSPGNLGDGYTVHIRMANGNVVEFEKTNRLGDTLVMPLDFAIAECQAHIPHFIVDGFPIPENHKWEDLYVWPTYRKTKYPGCEH